MNLRRYERADPYGCIHRGPFGAWWVWMTSPAVGEGFGVWNIAAVLFAAGDLYAASRLGVLAAVLAGIAGLVVAGWVGIVVIERRIQRRAAERLAAFWAARRLEPGPRPVPEVEEVAA